VEFSRKVLLFGTIFGFIFLSFVYFSLRNKRKNEKLLADAELLRLRQERMIAELTIREQVGRDMHDDLGAGLSALKLKTEMAMRVEKDALHFNQMKGLSITAGELIESMRQIIWSMSEDQSSVEDLVVYASNYGRTYLADHGVSLTYGHSQSWPPLELSSAQRRNVFLILKEAFHNIVKHAEADHVILEIQWKNGLSMVIKDNGKGIPSADSIANGNGLRNMKKRTEEMRGTLEWDGAEGTVIRLWIPLTTN
jgi:two-component system, NarL family, sensor kinase